MLNMNATTSPESEGPLIAEQFDELLGDFWKVKEPTGEELQSEAPW